MANDKRQITRRINALRAAADVLLAIEDEEGRPGHYESTRDVLRCKAELLELAASERKPAQRVTCNFPRPCRCAACVRATAPDEERDGIDRDTSDLHNDG